MRIVQLRKAFGVIKNIMTRLGESDEHRVQGEGVAHGAVHSVKLGRWGCKRCCNEPELSGTTSTPCGGLDQSLLIFAKEKREGADPRPDAKPGEDGASTRPTAAVSSLLSLSGWIDRDDAGVRHVLGPP